MSFRQLAPVVTTWLLLFPASAWARQGGGEPPPTNAPAAASETRLFFGATGRSLPRGHGYYNAGGIVMPSFQIGVTDRISLGMGTPVLVPGRVMWFTPKVQVYRGSSTSAAVGVVHVQAFGAGGVSVAYATATTGTADKAVTYGVGVVRAKGDGAPSGAMVFMIGGEKKVSPRVRFVTENYIFSQGMLASAGVRVSRGRLSADFALMAPISQGFFVVGPFLNFAWKF